MAAEQMSQHNRLKLQYLADALAESQETGDQIVASMLFAILAAEADGNSRRLYEEISGKDPWKEEGYDI